MTAEESLPLDPEPVPLDRWPDGTVRLRGSRTPFYLFVGAFDRGATPDQLAEQYDLLSLADIYTLIAYRLRHQAAVARYLAGVSDHAAEVRRKLDALYGPQPTKADFLARRAAREKAG